MEDQEHSALELGTMLGCKRTMGWLAARCSAEEARALRELRETKRYRDLGWTWEAFCQFAGISRAAADKTIRLFEELGAGYFQLACLARITPQAYRQIAGAVSEEGLKFQGETIAFDPSNSDRLTDAIGRLRRQAAPARDAPPASGLAPSDRAEKRLRGALAELGRLPAESLGPDALQRLRCLVEDCSLRLDEIERRAA